MPHVGLSGILALRWHSAHLPDTMSYIVLRTHLVANPGITDNYRIKIKIVNVHIR